MIFDMLFGNYFADRISENQKRIEHVRNIAKEISFVTRGGF
jgi:hypothetical protein